MTDVRLIAYEALISFDKGEYGNSFTKDILDKNAFLSKQERSFLNRLIEGSIERVITLDYIIDRFSKIKCKKLKPPVRALLRLSIYQLMYMDNVPESAAVNESVKIAKKKGLSGLTGYINGVLRSVARNKDGIEYPDKKDLALYYSVYYSCPKWIVELFIKQQGEDNTRQILENSVKVRPITGRVNITKASIDEIIHNNPETVAKVDILPNAISLHNIDNISSVNGFEEGWFTIQDISSQLVCRIAQIDKTSKVLDLCASPGGKSLHAADIAVEGEVLSCDITDKKLLKIEENIARCGFRNVTTRLNDATVFNEEFEEAFDVVIADVPCSGLGVIGRKNDIKYRISPEGIDSLIKVQRDILNNAQRYVKKGGKLIFSTCTINDDENLGGVEFIMKNHGLKPVDFYELLPDALKQESAKKGYLQLIGSDELTDGFFISKFVKE